MPIASGDDLGRCVLGIFIVAHGRVEGVYRCSLHLNSLAWYPAGKFY